MCRLTLLLLSFLLITACGDDTEEGQGSPSEPTTASPTPPAPNPEPPEPEPEPAAPAPEPEATPEAPPEAEAPTVPEDEANLEATEEPATEEPGEDDTVEEEPTPEPEAAAPPPPGPAVLGESDGLSVRELLVAESIEDRQPVGAGQRFNSNLPQIIAFLNVANDTPEPRVLMVAFERPDGRTTGQISLNIPPQAGRWRTWARSRNVRSEGRWSAVVTTPTGEEVGRIPFDVVAAP